MRRSIGLDVVRTFAILPVLVVHFVSQAFKSPPSILFVFGNFGVEIFFALSGYLIGGIILREFAADDLTGRAKVFYLRRWLRTIPLYLVFFVASVFVTHQGFKVAGEWTPANLLYLVFLQNLAWPMLASWYHESWSLAVEEWFYLLFPLLFAVLPGRADRRVLAIAILLIAAPLALRIWAFNPAANWDEDIRKIVVLRLDAIAYGILAIWLVRAQPDFCAKWRWVFGAAGLAGITFSTAVYLGAINVGIWALFTILFSLVSASFAAIVICADRCAVALPATLGTLVHWMSTRSYALYLCHATIIRLLITCGYFSGSLWLSLPLFVGGCALLAEASHRLIEQPFMKLRPSIGVRNACNVPADIRMVA